MPGIQILLVIIGILTVSYMIGAIIKSKSVPESIMVGNYCNDFVARMDDRESFLYGARMVRRNYFNTLLYQKTVMGSLGGACGIIWIAILPILNDLCRYHIFTYEETNS